MAENLGEARLRLTADSTKLDSKLQSASKQAKQLGIAFTAVGAAITAPLAAGVKVYAEYEQSMATVKAASQATEEEFAALDKIAREMGRTTVFTARESAQALTFMAMAGMDATTSITALPDVLNLAAAGSLELGQSADIVTNVMTGYGMGAEDITRAVDVMSMGFISANTDLSQLGYAFADGGPIAAAAGLQFEETAAILARMGNAGFQGSRAGTALRGAITRLLNPTDEAQAALDRMGVTVLDSNGKMMPLIGILEQMEKGGLTAGEAMTIFGQRAGPAMVNLVEQGADVIRELKVEMENAGGTAERVAKTKLATLSGQWTLLQSGVEGLALMIGQVLVPQITGFMDKITPLLQRVLEWTDANPGLTATIITVAAVVGGLTLAVGALLLAVGFLTPIIAAVSLPFVAVGVAIAAVILGVALLIAKWNEIIPIFQPVIDFIRSTVIPVFMAIVNVAWAAIQAFWNNVLKPVWDSVLTVFKAVWGFIQDSLIPMFLEIAEYVWPLLVEVWEQHLKPTWDELVKTVQDLIIPILQALWDKFLTVRDIILDKVVPALLWLFDKFKEVFDNYLRPILVPMIEGVFSFIETVIGVTFAAIRTLLAVLRGDWSAAWQGIRDIVTEIWEFLTGRFLAWKKVFTDLMSSLVNALKDKWDWAWNTIKSFFKNALDFIIYLVKNWNLFAVMKKIWDGILSLVNGVVRKIMGAIDRITSAVRRVKSAISSIAGGVGDVVGDVVGSFPSIPGLASGGIVTSPTLAMIGEAGPEAVVPLDGRHGMGTVNVFVEGSIVDVEGLANPVAEVLLLLRRQGVEGV